ncbi:MAG: LytTR family transcriptional regulator DNA-binding domain-containing protein [Bacteroidales bacterium]|jgi:DNA-binding LytR/AlgR family response regulator|nr:LytTR family transcriptional regulator DNA-binding domain-containing protein [Bacteroidales bacterium]
MNSYNINVLTENGKTTIDCNKILYIESSLQFTRVTLINNQTIELLLTMQEIEYVLLEQGFFKFNNRLLVNLKCIQVVFPSNASKVIMENGKEIFVNYNKREELFENLREVYELHELV